MKIVISSGHAKDCRGASGYLDEVDEARRVVNAVADLLKNAGVTTYVFHDDVSDDQSENLNRIVDFHNSKTRDLDISVHFNAYEDTSDPMGTEVPVRDTGGFGCGSIGSGGACRWIEEPWPKRAGRFVLSQQHG